MNVIVVGDCSIEKNSLFIKFLSAVASSRGVLLFCGPEPKTEPLNFKIEDFNISKPIFEPEPHKNETNFYMNLPKYRREKRLDSFKKI